MTTPAQYIVTFKDEGHDGGEPVGPVMLIDVAARHADPDYDPTAPWRPFGKRYAGETDLGWMPRSQAAAVAADHGVELTE